MKLALIALLSALVMCGCAVQAQGPQGYVVEAESREDPATHDGNQWLYHVDVRTGNCHTLSIEQDVAECFTREFDFSAPVSTRIVQVTARVQHLVPESAGGNDAVGIEIRDAATKDWLVDPRFISQSGSYEQKMELNRPVSGVLVTIPSQFTNGNYDVEVSVLGIR